MLTFLLIISSVLLLGLNIASIILIKRLLSKISTYETWVVEVKSDVMNTLTKMREIDTKGTFASGFNDDGKFAADDEVGQVFKELEELLEKLNQRIQ